MRALSMCVTWCKTVQTIRRAADPCPSRRLKVFPVLPYICFVTFLILVFSSSLKKQMIEANNRTALSGSAMMYVCGSHWLITDTTQLCAEDLAFTHIPFPRERSILLGQCMPLLMPSSTLGTCSHNLPHGKCLRFHLCDHVHQAVFTQVCLSLVGLDLSLLSSDSTLYKPQLQNCTEIFSFIPVSSVTRHGTPHDQTLLFNRFNPREGRDIVCFVPCHISNAMACTSG